MGRKLLRQVRRYMLWDCSSCGTSGINANKVKQCPQCGNPKELGNRIEREYRSSTIVDDTYKFKGADISCQVCGTENKQRFSCRNCGAALDKKFEKQIRGFTHTADRDWKDRPVQINDRGFTQAADTGSDWEAAVVAPTAPGRRAVRAQRNPTPPSTGSYTWWRDWRVLATATLTAILLAVLTFVFIQRSALYPTQATPTLAQWTYSLPLEDFAPREKSATKEDGSFWSPPGDAYDVNSQRVFVRSEDIYDQVYVSQTCTRTDSESYADTDGTWVTNYYSVDYDCSSYESQKVGERDIYGTRWQYIVDRWESIPALTANGKDQNPTFPMFRPTDTLRAAATATETYWITFIYQNPKGKNLADERYLDRTQWEQVELERPLPAIVDGLNSLRAIEGIDSNYSVLYQKMQR